MPYNPLIQEFPGTSHADLAYVRRGIRPQRPITSFVGREREIRTVRGLLASPDVRLLTLTGPGGVGKTRLAIEVAAAAQESLYRGVHYVAAAEVARPDGLLPAVAAALDIGEGGARPLLESISATLRDQPTLIILDNLEHLLPEAGDIVGKLIKSCPGLRVLATSRVTLRIYGEYRLPIRPMASTPCELTGSGGAGAVSEAVELFLQRAQASDPHFSADDEDLRAIAAICTNLDNLPLAIELAAASVVVLGPRVYLQRMEQRLPLPHGGVHNLPDRHRSVTATVAWSYELLPPAQRDFFGRLAVCSGPFDLAMAEALGTDLVIAGEPAGEASTSSVDLLIDLIDASLIQREPQLNGDVFYRMLNTIRSYALARLAETGETGKAQRIHAASILIQVETAHRHLVSGRTILHWLGFLERRVPNIHAAMRWCEDHDPGMLVRFTRYLMQFWLRRSRIREGIEWLSRLLSHRERLSDLEAAWMLTNLARMRQYLPSHDAGALYREALGIARRHGDLELQLTIHVGQVVHEVLKRQPEAAAEAFAAAMAVPDVWQVVPRVTQAAFLAGLEGAVAIALGDPARAEEVASTNLERALQDHDEASLGMLHRIRGMAAHELGDSERARDHFLASLEAYDRFQEEWNVGNCLSDLASLFQRDHPTLTLRLAGAANKLFLVHGVHGIDPDHEPFRTSINQLRERIGTVAVERAWREGSTEPWRIPAVEARTTSVDRVPWARPRTVPLHPSGPGGMLTPREHQVLLLVAVGMTDREIAGELGLSYRTITTYVSSILTKLNAASRAAAIGLAARQGFLKS